MKNSQNLFLCGPPLGPFWSLKCLNFDQNLPIWTAHHASLESNQTEVTKNLYYVLLPEGSQKKVSARGLYVVIKTYVLYIYILYIICMRSFFCSVRVYIILLFLPILLEKWFVLFLRFGFYVFIFWLLVC